MNLNGDEERIQRLFREMRSRDQRKAPRFAGVLEAAISGTARAQSRGWSLKLALLVATLIIVALAALAVIRHRAPGTAGNFEQQAMVNPDPPASPDLTMPTQPEHRMPPNAIKHIRHRRTSSEPAIDTASLFAWQSPTASLLKTSCEDSLMSLPRVGESLQTIKSFSPDLWN